MEQLKSPPTDGGQSITKAVQTASTLSTKRQDIELIRILSTLGIVWYHSGAIGHEAAYSGLILFIVISFLLEQNQKDRDLVQYTKDKARRLLTPWIIWFLIYGILNLLRGKPVINMSHGLGWGILAGTSIHLWYLPFIFICLVLYAHLKALASPSVLAVLGCGMFALAMIETPVWRPVSFLLGYPLAQYAHACAGVFLAIFFANLKHLSLTSALIGTGIAIASATSAIPWRGVGTTYLIAIFVGFCLVFRLIPEIPRVNLTKLSQYCFGIYLVHFFVLAALVKIALLLDTPLGISVPILAFTISLSIVMLGRRVFPRHTKYAL